jgi:hypothetical protein
MNAPTRAYRIRPKPERQGLPDDYVSVLAEVKRMIGESRRGALSAVNRELVWLYWQMGRIIVQQQESAQWGMRSSNRLSADLRAAFPDFGGLSFPNLWRMRQLFLAYRRMDSWLVAEKLSTGSREAGGADTRCMLCPTARKTPRPGRSIPRKT